VDDSRFAVGPGPLDVAAIGDLLAGHESTGAVVYFVGTVRRNNAGRQVTHIDYEAHEPLAIRTFQRIAEEVGAYWPSVLVALHHRLGRVGVGEASIVIAVASAHRAEAFAACRYVIERVKQIAPVWKHEFFEDGDVWVEGAVAHPDDEAARRDAFRRACA
jgi:molybdopterin synthase catalytic subunit